MSSPSFRTSDLLATESIGLAITLVILLLVFGAPVAAPLPVLLAIAGVTASLAGLYFLSGLTPVTYCLEAPNAEPRQLPLQVVGDRVMAHLIRVDLLHT